MSVRAVEHSIGALGSEAVPTGAGGYRRPYVIRCACKWRVRGRDVLAVRDAALDHVTGRTEAIIVMGFEPQVLDLDFPKDPS